MLSGVRVGDSVVDDRLERRLTSNACNTMYLSDATCTRTRLRLWDKHSETKEVEEPESSSALALTGVPSAAYTKMRQVINKEPMGLQAAA